MPFLRISVLLFWCHAAWAQFNIDSTYTYDELNKILELARENKDQETLGKAYYKLAEFESEKLFNNDKGLEYYNRALQYFKIAGDSSHIYKTYLAIADGYITAGLLDEAQNLLQKSMTYYQRKNDNVNLLRTNYIFSKLFKSSGEFEKSLKYLHKTLELSDNLQDSSLLSDALFDKIEAYIRINQQDSALTTAYKVFKTFSTYGMIPEVSRALFYIGNINRKQGRCDIAIKYLKSAEQFLAAIPYSETRRDIYNELALCHEDVKDYQEAYRYSRRYNALNDSIVNRLKFESYTNIALKYGTKDKQSSIEVLKIDKQYAEERNKSQKRIMYFLMAGLFLVLIAVYFIVRFYNQRIATNNIIQAQREEINARKIRELEDNIKISSMQSVIEGQEIERERIAKDLHDSLGGLLSTIKLKFEKAKILIRDPEQMKEFENAHNLLDTAVEEVRSIARNLQPGSLKKLGLVSAIKDLINRFEGDQYPDIDFQYYGMPEKMNKMIALSVYRIIQELLTNSLKHAKADEILIQLNADGDELLIQYEDDGVGFDPDTVHKGMGLENIISRITYLHGNISIDTEKGRGVSVMIRIKNIIDDDPNEMAA
ncbi:MAG: sensor histidine kinase [Saprospiraceae bacterium]|nr:sensor histidine kinase [Saprospiraceae bacterium]